MRFYRLPVRNPAQTLDCYPVGFHVAIGINALRNTYIRDSLKQKYFIITMILQVRITTEGVDEYILQHFIQIRENMDNCRQL